MSTTLDGVVEAPNTWQAPYVNDETAQALAAVMATSDDDAPAATATDGHA